MDVKYHKANDAIIQWAYLFEEVRPLRTSTCALFWRAVLLTPIKILGPAIVVLLFLSLVTFISIETFAPTWGQAVLGLRPPPKPAPWTAEDTRVLLWLLGLAAAAGLALYWLWPWLHGLCVPVEIEGGLVERGTCPNCGTTRLIEHEGVWECRRCYGHFVPGGQSVPESEPRP